jgi:hypothetical protein
MSRRKPAKDPAGAARVGGSTGVTAAAPSPRCRLPLPPTLRAALATALPDTGARFGGDLGRVRVVTGDTSLRTALGAGAVALPDQLRFAARHPDVRTIAHELAHIAQVRAFPSPLRLPAVSRRRDAAEREAERIADTVARGGTPGPILAPPAARIQRDEEALTCEPPNIGTFVLDPALADVATPARMTTHVRLAPPGGSAGERDRHVVLERPVRSARRLTVFAVPLYQLYTSAEAARHPRPIVSTDYPTFLDGDVAYSATGSATVVGVHDQVVFTDEPLQETTGAGAVVLLETDAGRVLVDGGMQLTDPLIGPAVGAELGRQLGGIVGMEPLGEAILVPGPPDGHALRYIAEQVGIRAVRATPDQLEDGSVAAVLQAQRAYRQWYERALRDDLTGRRAAWEATQAIAPNAAIREQRWNQHLEASVASALIALGTPGVALAERQGDAVVLHDDRVRPGHLPTPRAGEPLDLSDTEWEVDDEERAFAVVGDQRAGVFSGRGLFLRPRLAPAAAPVAPGPAAPRTVPGLRPSGPLGPGEAAPRPVTPWLALEAVGKESMLLVRIRGSDYFLVDAGGNPRVISVAAMTALAGRLGGGDVRAIGITHPHIDHVRYLEELILRYQIRAENLIVSARWPALGGTGPTGLIGRLRTTAVQAFTDLGYGPQWNPAGVVVDPARPVTSVRVPVPGGTVDVHARDAAARAYRGTHGEASHLADSASLLYVFGSESSGHRTAVIGDLRGEDLLDFHNDMERMRPGSFREAFRGVRVVAGLGHHLGFAAGREIADVQGLNHLLDATLVQNGELTILIQSNERFSFRGPAVTMAGEGGALLRYLNRLGVRVVFTGDAGTTSSGGLVHSDLSVTPYGTGTQVLLGDPRVTAVQHRLELLREARRTVAASSEFGPASLGLEGRTAAQLTSDLDAEIGRLEGLVRELRNLAAADLLDARAQPGESGAQTARRAAFRSSTTTAGRTEAQILADMTAEGPTEQALRPEVRQRLTAAIASGRPVTVALEFAAMPTTVHTAIEALTDDARRTALARRYRELAELTRTMEGDTVPEGPRLEVEARARALLDELVAAREGLTGDGRGALDAEVTRLQGVVERLAAETERTTVTGRDVAGRPTRTEYVRLRQRLAVDRAFHGAGRALGAIMVIHAVEGAVPTTTQEGEINIPQSALRAAHSALGMSIGVRMATTSFRQAMAAPVPGWVGAAEMAAMVVLEFGMAATGDYASAEERDAALVNTAITALCMAVGQGIMTAGAYVPHPIGRAVVMGLGLAVMLAGERVLRWLGLDEAVERWTQFPPGEVTAVNQRIEEMLRQYRLVIGAHALGARSDEELRAHGAADPAALRRDAVTVEAVAEDRADALERNLTGLFEDAYRRAQGAWVGLQTLDQQAADFHRLRQLSMRGRSDVQRAEIERRWRAIDAHLDLSGADAAAIDAMEQWGSLSARLGELEARLGDTDRGELLETLDRLRLMFENARYRIDPAGRGDLRPGAIIPPGTPAHRAYVARLQPLELRLASLQQRLVRWSGGTDDPALAASAGDATAMSAAAALGRLRATRRSYDGLVAALHADHRELAERNLWENVPGFIRAVEEANRSHHARFQLLAVGEEALRSAASQAELALRLTTEEIPAPYRQLVTDEVAAARQAVHDRKYRYGLVFLSERDAMVFERGRHADTLMAAAIDAAFPSAGRTATTGLGEEEEEALAEGTLARGGGRGMRSTLALLGEHRRRVAGAITIDRDRGLSLDPLDHNRLVQRTYFLLVDGFRYADFEGWNTYPWRAVPPGRTPIVVQVLGDHHGCNSEYCFSGPALYHRVIAVNRDAVLLLGSEPVYIRRGDLSHGITEQQMMERAGATAAGGP